MRSLVGGILLLRRIQLDLDSLLLFIDIKNVAEGLKSAGDHLNPNLALGNAGDTDLPFLVGPHFILGTNMFAQFDDGPALNEPHHHGGAEECYVLEGDLRTGDVWMHAGDYQHAAAGSVHPVQSTVQGCLLLIHSSLQDELLAHA